MAEFRKSFSRPANSNEQKIKETYDRLEKKEDSKIIQLRLEKDYELLIKATMLKECRNEKLTELDNIILNSEIVRKRKLENLKRSSRLAEKYSWFPSCY